MSTLLFFSLAVASTPNLPSKKPPQEKIADVTPASNPNRAYESGRYAEALAGFLERQKKRPNDPALLYNTGNAQYQLGDFSSAEKSFLAATTSPDKKLSQKAYYNLGNSFFKQNKLPEALKNYFAALALDSHDQDAKHNAEYVQQLLAQQQQQQQNSSSSPKKESEDQQAQQDGTSQPNQQQQEQPANVQEQAKQATSERPQSTPQENKTAQDHSAAPPDQTNGAQAEAQQGAVDKTTLDAAQIQRYLNMVQESRPKQKTKARQSRSAKDW